MTIREMFPLFEMKRLRLVIVTGPEKKPHRNIFKLILWYLQGKEPDYEVDNEFLDDGHLLTTVWVVWPDEKKEMLYQCKEKVLKEGTDGR